MTDCFVFPVNFNDIEQEGRATFSLTKYRVFIDSYRLSWPIQQFLIKMSSKNSRALTLTSTRISNLSLSQISSTIYTLSSSKSEAIQMFFRQHRIKEHKNFIGTIIHHLVHHPKHPKKPRAHQLRNRSHQNESYLQNGYLSLPLLHLCHHTQKAKNSSRRHNYRNNQQIEREKET